MESVKDLNRENYNRSRFAVWRKKKESKKEKYFENKTTYKQSLNFDKSIDQSEEKNNQKYANKKKQKIKLGKTIKRTVRHGSVPANGRRNRYLGNSFSAKVHQSYVHQTFFNILGNKKLLQLQMKSAAKLVGRISNNFQCYV